MVNYRDPNISTVISNIHSIELNFSLPKHEIVQNAREKNESI
jgi:hypothetical protein